MGFCDSQLSLVNLGTYDIILNNGNRLLSWYGQYLKVFLMDYTFAYLLLLHCAHLLSGDRPEEKLD